MARSLLPAVSGSIEHTNPHTAGTKYSREYTSEANYTHGHNSISKCKQSQIALVNRYDAVRSNQSFAWAAVSARQLDDVSEFVVRLWEPGHEQMSTLIHTTRAFASHVVQELGICETAMLASMVYMVRLRDVFAEKQLSTLNCSKQLFAVCLLTASKYLYDIPQTNKSWARVCQLDPGHINSMELELLDALSFGVAVTSQELDAARTYSRRRRSAPAESYRTDFSLPSPGTRPHTSRRYVSFSDEPVEACTTATDCSSAAVVHELESAQSFRDAFDGCDYGSRDSCWPSSGETFRRSYSGGVRSSQYYPWAPHHTAVHRSKSEGKCTAGIADEGDNNFSLFSYSLDKTRAETRNGYDSTTAERRETQSTLSRHQSVGATDWENATNLVQRRLQSLGLRDDNRPEETSHWGWYMTLGSDVSEPNSSDLNKSADSMSVLCASDCESVGSVKHPRGAEWWDDCVVANNGNYSNEYRARAPYTGSVATGLAGNGECNTGVTIPTLQTRAYSNAPVSRIKDGHVTWRDLRGHLALVNEGSMLTGDRSCDCDSCDVRYRYRESTAVVTKSQSLGSVAKGYPDGQQDRYAGYESEATGQVQSSVQNTGSGLLGAAIGDRDTVLRSQSMEPSFSMFSEHSEWGRVMSEGAETVHSTDTPNSAGVGEYSYTRDAMYTAPRYGRVYDYDYNMYAQQPNGMSGGSNAGYCNPENFYAPHSVTHGSVSNRVGGVAATSYYPSETLNYDVTHAPAGYNPALAGWVPMTTQVSQSSYTPVHAESDYVHAELTPSYRPDYEHIQQCSLMVCIWMRSPGSTCTSAVSGQLCKVFPLS